MKKKIALLLLSVTLIIGVASGCTDKQEDLSAMKADSEINTVEVIGIGEIEAELGIKVVVPATVTDESCRISDGSVGVVSFKSAEADFEYYIQAGEAPLDATGLAASLPNQGTYLLDNATYQMAYEDGGVGIAWWYDKTNQVACTLVMAATTDPALLQSTAESFIEVQN